MHLQKVKCRKTYKKIVFCWRREGNEENSRIRIRISTQNVMDPDPGSTTKCHGSATVVKTISAFTESIYLYL